MSSLGSSERATPSTTTMVFCNSKQLGPRAHVEQAGHLEQQHQQLRHRDVFGSAIVDRLADGADGLREALDRMMPRHVAGVEMHLRGAVIVAGDEAVAGFRPGSGAPSAPSRPMMPKSTATSLPSSSTNRLPGCMSAWKKPSRSAWRRKLWITLRPSAGRSKPLRFERAVVAEPNAVDPFQRQHLARGAIPIDRWHAEVDIFARILSHLGSRRGFQSEIHFDRDRPSAASTTTSMRRSRWASAEKASALRAAKRRHRDRT